MPSRVVASPGLAYTAVQQMLTKLRTLFGPKPPARLPSIPNGERVYAVGDIHGRLDLFEELIRAIEADDALRRPARTTMILLGDLVDRGADSAGVIARARAWGEQRSVTYIKGNHEEMFISAMDKIDALRGFLKFGGRETIMSYGVDAATLAEADYETLQQLMRDKVPQEDIDFLDGFEKLVRIGDYVFVHAGIRPESPLELQLSHDCRWIREPFLSHSGEFPGFVIHGHTVTEDPDVRHNRTGIDTGAFMSGKLTAIGLEGTERWFIQAETQPDGALASVVA